MSRPCGSVNGQFSVYSPCCVKLSSKEGGRTIESETQMDYAQIRFRMADPADQATIVELRKNSYMHRYQKYLDVTGLSWNKKDEVSIHFLAEYRGQIISTIRLFKMTSSQEFEDILPIKATHEFSALPSYVLSRAATHSEFSNYGVNLWLRLHVMEYLQAFDPLACFLYGTSRADAQRIGLLKELGYEFFAAPTPWTGFFKAQENPVVFRLDLKKHGSQAVQILKQTTTMKSGLK